MSFFQSPKTHVRLIDVSKVSVEVNIIVHGCWSRLFRSWPFDGLATVQGVLGFAHFQYPLLMC